MSSTTTSKPWPQLVKLRKEVRDGALSLEEFAANLFDVVGHTGQRPLYEDPERFFSLTYATPALRDIAAATAERLRGKSAKGVRQLELTYGGGKTHTMVTLTHLVRDPASLPPLPAVKEFESSMGGKAPRSRVAAVCFDKIDAEKGCPAVAPGRVEAVAFPALEHPCLADRGRRRAPAPARRRQRRGARFTADGPCPGGSLQHRREGRARPAPPHG